MRSLQARQQFAGNVSLLTAANQLTSAFAPRLIGSERAAGGYGLRPRAVRKRDTSSRQR